MSTQSYNEPWTNAIRRQLRETEMVSRKKIASSLCRQWQDSNLNQTEIAALLKTKPNYISQVMCGAIEKLSIAQLCDWATDSGFEVHMKNTTLLKIVERPEESIVLKNARPYPSRMVTLLRGERKPKGEKNPKVARPKKQVTLNSKDAQLVQKYQLTLALQKYFSDSKQTVDALMKQADTSRTTIARIKAGNIEHVTVALLTKIASNCGVAARA